MYLGYISLCCISQFYILFYVEAESIQKTFLGCGTSSCTESMLYTLSFFYSKHRLDISPIFCPKNRNSEFVFNLKEKFKTTKETLSFLDKIELKLGSGTIVELF